MTTYDTLLDEPTPRELRRYLPAAIPWWVRLLWIVAVVAAAEVLVAKVRLPESLDKWFRWYHWYTVIPLAVLLAETLALFVDAVLVGGWRSCRDPYLDKEGSWKARAYDEFNKSFEQHLLIASASNVQDAAETFRRRLEQLVDRRFFWYFAVAWLITVLGFLSFVRGIDEHGVYGVDFHRLFLALLGVDRRGDGDLLPGPALAAVVPPVAPGLGQRRLPEADAGAYGGAAAAGAGRPAAARGGGRRKG